MNREKLEERIKTLETERDQMRTNLVAYDGAIQDCKYWLSQLLLLDDDNRENSLETEKN